MGEGKRGSSDPPSSGDHEAATRALFRSIALDRKGYYDARPGGPPRLSFWQRRIRRAVERILDERLRGDSALRRVLDAGCGRGDFTQHLAARYRELDEIVGCDFSPELLDLARSNAAGQDRIRFSAGDLTALPFASSSFDATVCLNVLHHVRDGQLAIALEQLARVTAGVLLVEIKNASSPYFRMHSRRVEGVAVFPATVERLTAGLRPLGFALAGQHAIFGLSWLSPIILLHFERAPAPGAARRVSGAKSA